MATYSLSSIDAQVFDQFVAKPSASDLTCIEQKLTDADITSPAWADDPTDWIRQHVSEPDWYKGLTEEEMQAWESAIRTLLDEPKFGRKAHGYHCAVGDMFINIAARVYDETRGEKAVVCQFWPYRFFDDYGLDGMGYFPTHALLTNGQVGKLIEEICQYDSLLDELAKSKPDFVERWRDQIHDDMQEGLPALREIHNQKRMWYSQFDF